MLHWPAVFTSEDFILAKPNTQSAVILILLGVGTNPEEPSAFRVPAPNKIVPTYRKYNHRLTIKLMYTN